MQSFVYAILMFSLVGKLHAQHLTILKKNSYVVYLLASHHGTVRQIPEDYVKGLNYSISKAKIMYIEGVNLDADTLRIANANVETQPIELPKGCWQTLKYVSTPSAPTVQYLTKLNLNLFAIQTAARLQSAVRTKRSIISGVPDDLARRQAETSRLPTQIIETVSEAIAVLRNVDAIGVTNLLRRSCEYVNGTKSTNDIKIAVEQIDKYFLAGDLINAKNSSEFFYSDLLNAGNTIIQQIIVERNKNFLNTITNNLDKFDRQLVVVGAAHMAGDLGLINLLVKNGFEVSTQ